MHDHSTHKLLAQIPLTVSPFAQLPTSITLPYDYTTLPAALPAPSSSLIVSSSGLSSATPASLIQSCNALLQHLSTENAQAKQKVDEWIRAIKDKDLMEKRKIAPGYLDTGVVMLEPTKVDKGKERARDSSASGEGREGRGVMETVAKKGDGEELDRAFGKMGMDT